MDWDRPPTARATNLVGVARPSTRPCMEHDMASQACPPGDVVRAARDRRARVARPSHKAELGHELTGGCLLRHIPRTRWRVCPLSDRILTLAQAAEIVPLSRSTLYRVAEAGGDDCPFWKRGGRWLTIESDLFQWVREGERGQTLRREEGRMHRARSRRRSSFSEKVAKLERSGT